MKSPAELFDLTGKIALVTGSNRGIGLALAEGLGRSGAIVVVNGRNAERTEAAALELAAKGIEAVSSIVDMTNAEAVKTEVARIEATIGPIEILVNNAGMQHRAPMAEFPLEMFKTLLETNLHGAFYASQAVARYMIERRRGSIINLCSVMSELGRSSIVPYTMSKGGIKMMTKGMATELGHYGIRVNGLGPGYFKTELNDALVNDATFSDWLVKRTPLGRWGEVDELVGATVFLASQAASFVTGQIIYVDGGITSSV
jgi:gluconate 5-dehydrogenase